MLSANLPKTKVPCVWVEGEHRRFPTFHTWVPNSLCLVGGGGGVGGCSVWLCETSGEISGWTKKIWHFLLPVVSECITDGLFAETDEKKMKRTWTHLEPQFGVASSNNSVATFFFINWITKWVYLKIIFVCVCVCVCVFVFWRQWSNWSYSVPHDLGIIYTSRCAVQCMFALSSIYVKNYCILWKAFPFVNKFLTLRNFENDINVSKVQR